MLSDTFDRPDPDSPEATWLEIDTLAEIASNQLRDGECWFRPLHPDRMTCVEYRPVVLAHPDLHAVAYVEAWLEREAMCPPCERGD